MMNINMLYYTNITNNARLSRNFCGASVIGQSGEKGPLLMSLLRRIATEPLMQFALIGIVLFAVDRVMAPAVTDPREIRVDDSVYARLAGIFQEAEQRLPDAEEMDRLVERYILNETLFREARALELDHGDEMMRERLIQRMRLLIYSGLEVAPPDDATLKAWLAENPDRYDQPARVSFRVIGLDATEAEARAEAERAATREAAGEPIKPEGVRMLSFISRPRAQLSAVFEESFIAAIEAAPRDTWSAVPSSRGWQVVKLLDATPSYRPRFDEIRQTAAADWREAEIQRQARRTLDSMIASYPVRREAYAPDRLADILPEIVGVAQ